jgi:aminomethyltransferase
MLRQTALIQEHRRLNAKLVDFGGWEMPIQYTGITDEHLACRTAAGLFDVSHMGEVIVEGKHAESYLSYLITNDVSKLAVGHALYTVMCHENGGTVDDLVIYRRGQEHFLVVVNASNTEKDFNHMLEVKKTFEPGDRNLQISNVSDQYTQIAIQGRNALSILSQITSAPLSAVKTYGFIEDKILRNIPSILARTGYTGEDGFEIYLPWSQGPTVWNALIEAGRLHGLKPCGLGARDTLRLEMKYPLYGNELTDNTHPLEAGLGWVVKWDKVDFLGKAALLRAKENGLERQLAGIRLLGKGIMRHGYSLYLPHGTEKIGELTSGTFSPSLNLSIGIGYVTIANAKVGSKIAVDIRGQQIPAEIVPTPFYKRTYV